MKELLVTLFAAALPTASFDDLWQYRTDPLRPRVEKVEVVKPKPKVKTRKVAVCVKQHYYKRGYRYWKCRR